jgi:hypothetical protein
MALTATPKAATAPTSIFDRFLLLRGRAACRLSALAAASAGLAASLALASASAAAARLAICSSIIRTSFLYGDQKACRMLIGLEMILVIVAS